MTGKLTSRALVVVFFALLFGPYVVPHLTDNTLNDDCNPRGLWGQIQETANPEAYWKKQEAFLLTEQERAKKGYEPLFKFIQQAQTKTASEALRDLADKSETQELIKQIGKENPEAASRMLDMNEWSSAKEKTIVQSSWEDIQKTLNASLERRVRWAQKCLDKARKKSEAREPRERLSKSIYDRSSLDFSGHMRVVDGDSLAIDGTELRLIGIDAVELHQSCLDANDAEYPCGVKAKKAMQALVADKTVTCHGEAIDVYDRPLTVCYAGQTDINRAMVKQGWAISLNKKYREDESLAREQRLGIWQGSFEKPKSWRKEHPYKEMWSYFDNKTAF